MTNISNAATALISHGFLALDDTASEILKVVGDSLSHRNPGFDPRATPEILKALATLLPDSYGKPALHCCTTAEEVNLLLQLGVDKEEKSKKGWPPLFLACRTGNEEAAIALVEAGADPNRAVEDDFATPLHEPCRYDRWRLTRALITAGADLNAAPSEKAWTPLHIACDLGRIHSARLLIAAGANLQARNSDNHTPLDLCSDDMMRALIVDTSLLPDEPDNLERVRSLVIENVGQSVVLELLKALVAKRPSNPETLAFLDALIAQSKQLAV